MWISASFLIWIDIVCGWAACGGERMAALTLVLFLIQDSLATSVFLGRLFKFILYLFDQFLLTDLFSTGETVSTECLYLHLKRRGMYLSRRRSSY